MDENGSDIKALAARIESIGGFVALVERP